MANGELFGKIMAVYDANHGVYGSPRIYQELHAQRVHCSENRVARLMRLRGLQAIQTKRFKSVTKRNKAHRAAPNLLNRDFTVDRPGQKWLADITYIATMEGWLYLAAILDLYSRRIVGWAMTDRATSEMTQAALQMALRQHGPVAELIHHSDQGSQYTDGTYQAMLTNHGIQASMNGVGTWYDNAPMESFFATLKSELIHHRRYRTRNEARTSLFVYIESFYNQRRRHSALGYLSPDAYERMFYQETQCFA
jgi:transposase InsO family protein